MEAAESAAGQVAARDARSRALQLQLASALQSQRTTDKQLQCVPAWLEPCPVPTSEGI